MRSVALVTSSFLPRTGGVEEHVRHLATRLHRRGHRVAVWSVDRGDRPAELPGVPVRYLPAPLPSASAAGAARFVRAAPQAFAAWERAWRLDRPDVIHVQCFGPNGPWATAMSRLHRTPLVVGTHGETFMDEHRLFESSRLQQAALRCALTQASAVTACSQYAATDLARFGLDPTRAEVVYNGVEPDEHGTPVPGLPRRYLLGLGRLVRVKGFDLLLRAYASADLGALEGPEEVGLVIAGDGPERAALAALAAELGVADRVVFTGGLDRGGVATAIAGAEALVVPSRVEAFGIVVLEGLRAGVPVVVTSRGGASEIVTDAVSGLVVDPVDPDALADALGRVVTDAGLRSKLCAEGPRTAASFSWDAVTDRVLTVYDRTARDA